MPDLDSCLDVPVFQRTRVLGQLLPWVGIGVDGFVFSRPHVNERGFPGRMTEVREGIERPVGVFGEVRREEYPLGEMFSENPRVVGPPLDAVDQ